MPTTWSAAIHAARDPTTPPGTLHDLARIPALEALLARNPNTPPATLITIAPHYPEHARHNPNLPLAYLQHGSGQEHELHAILNPTPPTTNPHHPYTLDWPRDHPAYANPTLIHDTFIDELTHRYRSDPQALRSLADNPNLTHHHLSRLARHPNPEVRYHATRNPTFTTRDLLNEARDGHEHNLPYQTTILTALAERNDPNTHAWLTTVLPPESSLRAFLHTRHTPPAPPPRPQHHAATLARLRNHTLTAPHHTEPHLNRLTTDPTTHPTTRARAALTCHAALAAARVTRLLAVTPAGPRARRLAQALRDTLAVQLIDHAMQRRATGESSVFIPF